jgi:hypothetical protein
MPLVEPVIRAVLPFSMMVSLSGGNAMLEIGPGSRRVTTIITQDYQELWAEKSVLLSRRFLVS